MKKVKQHLAGVILLLTVLAACTNAVATPAASPTLTPLPTLPPEPTNTPLPELDDSEETAVPEACSIAGQQAQIDAALNAYQAMRTDDANPVLDINQWVSTISADITTNCLANTFQLTDPGELATLLEALQAGGYVIYVRHTHTDRSRGDTDVSLGSCDTQRILSEQGREEALFIRNAYQQLNLSVGELISTQYCRTLETAILAFGVPQVISREALHATLPERLATEPEAGSNTIIVAHIGTIRDRVGLPDTFEEGDSFVFRPTGNGRFEFVGRIGLYDWPIMAALQSTQ